jgi:hypothetical protein
MSALLRRAHRLPSFLPAQIHPFGMRPGEIRIGLLASAWLTRSAISLVDIIDASSTTSRVPGVTATVPRAPRRPGRWPMNSAVL